jgi:myosin heavy subunit
MMQSFINIKISKEELSTVLSILSAIMFLGNITFDKSTLTDQNPLTIREKPFLKKIASLLRIPEEVL